MKLEAVQWIVYCSWLASRCWRHEIQGLAREGCGKHFRSSRKNSSPVPIRHPKILGGSNITSSALRLRKFGRLLLDDFIQYLLCKISNCRPFHSATRVPQTRPSRDDARWGTEWTHECNSPIPVNLHPLHHST